MPFTPAHPAIVLPFLKVNPRYLSATALVMGSIAPDFEYFFKMAVNSQYSHTLAGLFYFDLPVTVFLSILFHLYVKKNLISNLPRFIQLRLLPLRDLDFISSVKNNFIGIVVGAVIGSLAHILWDNFTHGDGFFVMNFPVFFKGKAAFFGVRYPVWYALQYISTFGGLACILGYILLQRVNSAQVTVKPKIQYWFVIMIISFIIVAARFNFGWRSVQFGNFVVSCIAALCISLVLAGLIRFKVTETIA